MALLRENSGSIIRGADENENEVATNHIDVWHHFPGLNIGVVNNDWADSVLHGPIGCKIQPHSTSQISHPGELLVNEPMFQFLLSYRGPDVMFRGR